MSASVQKLVSYARERPLWSAAAALLVALIAIPVFLLKSGDSPAPVPAPAVAAANRGTEVVVRPAAPSTLNDADRHLVGKPKDPFATTAKDAAAAQAAAKPAAGSPPASSGAGSATASAPSSATAVVSAKKHHAARPPVKRYYQVDVRFGQPGKLASTSDVPRLQPLPATGAPALLFFGVFNQGRSAGFLVAKNSLVKASSCASNPRNCQLVRLGAGRTANVAVRAANGQLRVFDLTVTSIHKVLTRNAHQASKARANVSKNGRCMLATAGNAFGTYLLNPVDGSYMADSPGHGACKGIQASVAREAKVFASARTAQTP